MCYWFHRFSNLIIGLFLHLAQPDGGSQNQAKPTSYFIPVPGNKDVKVDWKLFFKKTHKKIIKSCE